MTDPFRVLVVGWSAGTISAFWDRLHDASTLAITHVIASPREFEVVRRGRGLDRILYLRDEPAFSSSADDPHGFLDSFAHPTVPTIHNMILGDRVVREIPYESAIAYAARLARALESLLTRLNPSVVIASFDNLHAGLSLAVARRLGIPWFALQHPTIPFGLAGFCSGMTPDTVVSNGQRDATALRQLAEVTLERFERQQLEVPAYISSHSWRLLAARFPAHLKELFWQTRLVWSGRFDPLTEYPVRRLMAQYVRKRVNRFRLPDDSFLRQPPRTPYVFFGLHMQPESSIDVWAPFHANQFAVIETISRSTPSTHRLLVKIHKSDADGHSVRQLRRLRQLPGVQLVSPFVDSRPFIRDACLIAAIQGTIALEGALMGKPVLMFGASPFERFPGVQRAAVSDQLPMQIRAMLAQPLPDRAEIIEGLCRFLSSYATALGNDWQRCPAEDEIKQTRDMFMQLRDSLLSNS